MPIKTLVLPQKGIEEPWLSDLAEVLDGSAELAVLDVSEELDPSSKASKL